MNSLMDQPLRRPEHAFYISFVGEGSEDAYEILLSVLIDLHLFCSPASLSPFSYVFIDIGNRFVSGLAACLSFFFLITNRCLVEIFSGVFDNFFLFLYICYRQYFPTYLLIMLSYWYRGGPYREALSMISDELMSSSLPLFIPSPNGLVSLFIHNYYSLSVSLCLSKLLKKLLRRFSSILCIFFFSLSYFNFSLAFHFVHSY